MIYSMTGFGKAVAECNGKRLTAEIKSLNSKQLDFASRLPALYRELEPEMRSVVSATMQRGKVDLTVTAENITPDGDVTINLDRIEAYRRQVDAIVEKLGIPAPADWMSLLVRFPEVFTVEANPQLSDDERALVLSTLTEAVNALGEFRRKEGVKLEAFFKERIANIRALLAEVPRYETERIVKIRTRIEEALKQIPQADYDRGRFEQEMIFYIEKLDITEEKQRLTQHLDYFLETIDAAPGQGKKLGFIAQEMGREINTLGSKSNHAELQIIVVKMKDELEQIKEQVLNVL